MDPIIGVDDVKKKISLVSAGTGTMNLPFRGVFSTCILNLLSLLIYFQVVYNISEQSLASTL